VVARRNLAEKATFVFDGLAKLGLAIPVGSRFDRMRQQFIAEDGSLTRPASPKDPTFRIALEALREFQLLEPILESLGHIDVKQGKHHLKSLVRDAVLPHQGKETRGRDLQAELLVAATCVRAGMLPVSLEEPDVRTVIDGQGWRIAVKRVKNQERLDDNLRDAADQASRSGEPGVIFLDVSQAFNPGDDQMTRPLSAEHFHALFVQGLRRGISLYERSVLTRARAKDIGLVYFFFSGLRHDPVSGWELATIHMDVDTAVNEVQRESYRPFKNAFGRGIGFLAAR
jgi:hypothetical protein